MFAVAVLAASLAAASTARAQLAPAPAAAAPGVSLTFNADGTVNLAARNVTVRQILLEWARQCGCYVVNAEKLASAPIAVPVQFDHQAQARVLDSLLRQAAGYVLTPRRPDSAIRSDYETIYILATSTATGGGGYTSMPPPVAPILTPGSVDDEIPPIAPPSPLPASAPPPSTPPAGRPNTPFVPAFPTGGPASPSNAPASSTPSVTPPLAPLPAAR